MNGETISDISTNKTDSTGAEITTVYGKIGGIFAVYGTPERVMIQYADDQALGLEQRRALGPLNPLRGEINGLVDGWRSSATPRDKCRAKLFDRRTADALTAALQGDQVHAEELLKAVKADVLEERVSIGRTEYLSYAVCAALAVFIGLGAILALSAETNEIARFIRAENLWLAAGMGCLGALFSIALGIRARDIRTDLQRRDNIADAILRIVIGALSAIILFSFLRSELITIAGVSIDGEDTRKVTHVAIIIAFLAGFSERLVGNFLTRAADSASAGTTIAGAAGMTSAAAQAAAQPEVEATERNPRGKQEIDILGTIRGEVSEGAAHAHDDDIDVDGCVCDVTIAPEEMTDDVELPEASGGVEKAA
jgi:hypothetical protein